MKFTFIVPVFQGYQAVGRCLDSIAAQTVKDYELIVVNDGYDKRMYDMVREGSPNAKYFEYPHFGMKGGFAGIDIGIHNASDSEFTYILNGDNLIYPDFIEKMYDADAHILTCEVKMNDMPGVTLNGTAFNKGSFDRANYAVRTNVAKRIGYKNFNMMQDDWYWFMACYDYISSKSQVIIHHVPQVLAEHN